MPYDRYPVNDEIFFDLIILVKVGMKSEDDESQVGKLGEVKDSGPMWPSFMYSEWWCVCRDLGHDGENIIISTSSKFQE